jgi:hypothetical protein
MEGIRLMHVEEEEKKKRNVRNTKATISRPALILRTLLFLDVAIKHLDMVSAMLAGFCPSRDVEASCMQWF